MDDHLLVQLFEAGEVPPGGFHHADHVRVAWWYLCRHPLTDALDHFRQTLQRFALAQGKPGLYHETITTAYLLLINQRLAEAGRDVPWAEFARCNADLLSWRPSILERYYHDETLRSDKARRTFLMPDRLAE
jgi:hypothetical protein